MTNDPIPQNLREEYIVRKFGGPDPDALRPEDLIEEVVIVFEHGRLVSHTVTRPDAPPVTPQ